jgi:hypothetical protein
VFECIYVLGMGCKWARFICKCCFSLLGCFGLSFCLALVVESDVVADCRYYVDGCIYYVSLVGYVGFVYVCC